MNIAVLVSGGVDSSVALRLLKDQGHTLTAFYLKIWLEDELSFLGTCPWQEDLTYVQAVCEQLTVPLQIVSFQKEYWENVVHYTLEEIKKGHTPNPDILCNQQVKFGAFYKYIGAEFDKVATGHYAQIIEHQGVFNLSCSPDSIKDQTYFLALLTQKQLSKALFPLGHFSKEEVRSLAEKYDLPTKNRKDSQGICFLGKLKFNEFIKHYCGEKSGDIIEYETGYKKGEHKGFWFHTIGQRQGLGLSHGPWYVVAKNSQKNIIYVSRTYYEPDKTRNTFLIQKQEWLSKNQENISVKLRHGPHRSFCTLKEIEENLYQVTLSENDQGIASGQFAVFYNGTVCLGGTLILERTVLHDSKN